MQASSDPKPSADCLISNCCLLLSIFNLNLKPATGDFISVESLGGDRADRRWSGGGGAERLETVGRGGGPLPVKGPHCEKATSCLEKHFVRILIAFLS